MALLGSLLSGQYEGTVPGVALGTVKENWDDKHQGMLKIELFLGEQGKSITGWAPVMAHYAGRDYGSYFLPEVGQAVVVAFEQGEKSCPIVIGALWDKKNTLPKKTANQKNTIKRLRTKGGCEVVFDDEKGKENILVTTPAKLSLCLDDEKKRMTIKDEKGENAVTLDCKDGNIAVRAKNKITFSIGTKEVLVMDKNNVKITNQNIKQEAKGTFSADGQNLKLAAKANVNIEGRAGVAAKANGSMKLQSSGILEVKGGMVKIN